MIADIQWKNIKCETKTLQMSTSCHDVYLRFRDFSYYLRTRNNSINKPSLYSEIFVCFVFLLNPKIFRVSSRFKNSFIAGRFCYFILFLELRIQDPSSFIKVKHLYYIIFAVSLFTKYHSELFTFFYCPADATVLCRSRRALLITSNLLGVESV